MPRFLPDEGGARRLFSRAAQLLAETADYRDTLAHTLAACLPELGDFGFFDARGDGEAVERVALAYQDEETEALLRPTRWTAQLRPDINLCALSTGAAALHRDIDDAWYRNAAGSEAHLAILRRLAFRSMITVPMRHRGELIGALTLFMGRSGRQHTEDHLALAGDLAGIASPVVANALLAEQHAAATEALRISEERLRMSVEAARVGVWEWRPDGSVYWSPEYRAIYGLPEDEAPTFGRGMGAVHAEDLPLIEAAWGRTIATGAEFATRHRVHHPTAGLRWVQTMGRLLLDDAGQPQRVTGVAIDVTERERNERELAELRERLSEELRAMRRLHQISVRPISADEQPEEILGEILAAALELTGRDRGAIQLVDGELLRVVASRNFSAPFAEAVRLVARDRNMPSALAWREGRRVAVSDLETDPVFGGTAAARLLLGEGIRAVQSTPLVSRAGQVVGLLTTHAASVHHWSDREMRLLDLLSREAADILERAQADAQLRDADRRKDEFLAILAHELRNPLAPIRYAVSVAREPGSNEAHRRRAESVIERQVAHMGRLLDDLLDVSRIARGKVTLKREHVRLRAIAAAALEAARPLCEAKQHHFHVRWAEGDTIVDADPVRLTQILTNLLNNAAKYTEPGGRIELAFVVEGRDLALSVTDNGIGISPEVRPRLFTLFSQAQGAAQRAEGGLGIGLALVKGFVELHGGTVALDANPAGKGSVFRVLLPGLVVSPQEASIEPGAPVARRALRVLVADDNPDICEMCATLLRLWGHEVLLASNGNLALEMARRERPDVAILDIGMPRLSGYDVAQAIRRELGDGMALIAVTGWGQEEAKARTAEAGFDHHLTKPVEPAALESLLAAVAASARAPQRATPA
jgi:PAS domain S-box-containing protein